MTFIVAGLIITKKAVFADFSFCCHYVSSAIFPRDKKDSRPGESPRRPDVLRLREWQIEADFDGTVLHRGYPLLDKEYFGLSERFWLNLQSRYDLEVQKDKLDMRFEREVRVLTLKSA